MTVHHLLEAEQEVLNAVIFYKERAGVIYRVEGGEILIVALAHTSRQPDYWRSR